MIVHFDMSYSSRSDKSGRHFIIVITTNVDNATLYIIYNAKKSGKNRYDLLLTYMKHNSFKKVGL